MPKKRSQFPDEVYIAFEGEGDDRFLNAQESAHSFDHDQKVAIYKLVEVRTKIVEHHLE